MGIYYSPFIMLDYYALSFFCVTAIDSDTIIIFCFCFTAFGTGSGTGFGTWYRRWLCNRCWCWL
jgi:hypothetical protein